MPLAIQSSVAECSEVYEVYSSEVQKGNWGPFYRMTVWSSPKNVCIVLQRAFLVGSFPFFGFLFFQYVLRIMYSVAFYVFVGGATYVLNPLA